MALTGSGSRRRRSPVVLLVFAVLAGLWTGRVQSTEAAWTDVESAGATLSALVVPPPEILSCVTDAGLLGAAPRVILTWRQPTSITPSGYQAYATVGGLLPVLLTPLLGSYSTEAGPGAGQYVTTFNLGLLSGVLGGTFTVGLASTFNEWVSVPVARSATFNGLGSASACSVSGQG